ncbi:MAG: DUF2797 domain-containing protein [Flavobacteriaceae bacterium]|jgi:hypothetical protein|nr:DUF2797 domain-containing protein [Flavobacteriaceae bacterium]MDG0967176.1 DUF2797 domain-containing protein [Flavobacteriaceae bacterium]
MGIKDYIYDKNKEKNTMMEGVLVKMKTELNNPIRYYLTFPSMFVRVNELIGKTITFTHTGYCCLNCGSNETIFRQGFCKRCFFETPTAGDWIMRPELSQAHLDIEDRDLAYEKKVQLQPHVVYLAVSSGLKVGVTRKTQVPTRWIDQGAHQTIPIVEVPNRYLAGITEVALKEHYNDKTNWRRMLTQDPSQMDLVAERDRALQWLPQEVNPYIKTTENDATLFLQFPLEQPPTKVKSVNLTKSKMHSGKLVGIKGQYLVFADQSVMNVRSHEGVSVRMEVT